MKTNRFLWLCLFALLGCGGIYLLSCRQDADKPDIKIPGSNPSVSYRDTCFNTDYCNISITTDDNTTMDLCGDIPWALTSCSGCNSSTDVGVSGVVFLKNETRRFCVAHSASICITNTGSSTVNVTVEFGLGTSTPMTVSIAPSGKHCFHTNGNCTLTADDCL